MNKVLPLAVVAVLMAASSQVRADEVVANGGFETAGPGGPTSSANWLAVVAGAPGRLSLRDATSPRTGSFAHHIRAVGANGMGSSGILIQNSLVEGARPSLQQLTTVRATFSTKVALGPGGVGFYAMRILNRDGAIVASTGLLSMTDSAGMFRSFSMGPLNVPAFGSPPNDAFASFLELVVSAGAFPASNADAIIDDVSVTGTLVASCAADFNQSGGISVQDIFDFLAAWFASNPSADFNGVGGVTVQDIFDFLAAWFAGCP